MQAPGGERLSNEFPGQYSQSREHSHRAADRHSRIIHYTLQTVTVIPIAIAIVLVVILIYYIYNDYYY